MSFVTDFIIDSASQTEITNLDGTVLVEKDVGWLEISVDDTCLVKVLQGMEKVPKDGLDVIELKIQTRFHEFLEIAITEFEN